MSQRRKISPAIALWFLLAIALAIFVGISFSDDLSLGNYTLKKASFRDTLLAQEEIEEEEDETLPDSVATAEKEIVAEPDTTVHNVLVFGDSMTHHLAMSIAKYGTKNNYKVTGVTWESSSIPGWSSSGKIGKYIEMSHPDFIIISLGSNEMELRNFDARIPQVKKIVEEIETIPYVWVGPPLWKEDKGVYKMLDKALPKGVLFRIATDVEIPRGPDKVHPTRKGADVWTDTLMRWIKNSPHPILTEKPDSNISIKSHKFIYLHPDD